MRKLWLPGALYRALPLVYLVAGTAMLATFGDDTMGRTSGLLLLAAGGLIWVLRVVASAKRSSHDH